MQQAVAFSGGKDSTALVLGMAERGEDFIMIFNRLRGPVDQSDGAELPELLEHVERIANLCNRPLEYVSARYTLLDRIGFYNSLPSHRIRWCTEELKILPTKMWLREHPGTTLCVGLRADEPGREGGLYGDDVPQRFPLREWGWTETDVWAYLDQRGVTVPDRTDCALCYDQRLAEWYKLWRHHPEVFALGEQLEEQTGHTFRSPTAGRFPHQLKEMRAKFERGEVPRGVISLPLFDDYDEAPRRCRVCQL